MPIDDKFITVRTFTYIHELALAQMLLESENIECLTKDELTIQAHPFYSNAIGGVKLQVKQHDFEKAVEFLKNGGYLKDEDLEDDNVKLHNKLIKLTTGIPYLNSLKLKNRLIVLGLIGTAVLIITFILIRALL